MIDLRNKLYSEIARVLAEKELLSAKDVHVFLKGRGLKPSYQYVHKCLKVLEKQGLVWCRKGKYSLNGEYLKQWRDFLVKASNTYNLDQNVFVESITGSLLKLFKKEEAEEITKGIVKELNKKVVGKLDRWYCDFYDVEGVELKTIFSETDFKGKSVLEIGCGTGRVTRELAKVAREVIAVDHNKDVIAYDQEKFRVVKNVKFEVANFDSLKSLKKEYFDIVLCGWIGLHHTEEVEKAVNVMYSLLKKGGMLLILEAYPDSEYVKVLNLLKPKKSTIKEGQERLRSALYKKFNDLKEKIVSTRYVFPSFEELEEKFKIELVYEEGYEWREADSARLKQYVDKKESLEIGEVFIFVKCEKSSK